MYACSDVTCIRWHPSPNIKWLWLCGMALHTLEETTLEGQLELRNQLLQASLQSTTPWTHQTGEIFLWWVNVSRTEETHRELISLFLCLWCTQVDCGGKACVHRGTPRKHRRNHPPLPVYCVLCIYCVPETLNTFQCFLQYCLCSSSDLGLTLIVAKEWIRSILLWV